MTSKTTINEQMLFNCMMTYLGNLNCHSLLSFVTIVLFMCSSVYLSGRFDLEHLIYYKDEHLKAPLLTYLQKNSKNHCSLRVPSVWRLQNNKAYILGRITKQVSLKYNYPMTDKIQGIHVFVFFQNTMFLLQGVSTR